MRPFARPEPLAGTTKLERMTHMKQAHDARGTEAPHSGVRAQQSRARRAPRDRGTAAAGSIAEEGEVAGGDEFRAEAGVCTQHAAVEEGFLRRRSSSCRLVEGRGVGGLGGLARAGEVVPCGDDVGWAARCSVKLASVLRVARESFKSSSGMT